MNCEECGKELIEGQESFCSKDCCSSWIKNDKMQEYQNESQDDEKDFE